MTAFATLFVMVALVAMLRSGAFGAEASAHAFVAALEEKPQPRPNPYPEYDDLAFWLYPDWDAAGEQAVWMVPQKKPAEAMTEYDRGLMHGRKMWDDIEALPVDRAAKEQMRYELALRLAARDVWSPDANTGMVYNSDYGLRWVRRPASHYRDA